ncbi:hypothetical protein ABH935_005705 [Catenulispora sp. GAS73]|uniref:NlpC/P60 family protein n=1 Tax=Catenulispora sp. GAS73 TaxID=3156269 RepID=UPI0035130ABD
MNLPSRPRTRVALTVGATAIGLIATVVPAHADYVYGSFDNFSTPTSSGSLGPALGGPITRDQIIARAREWTTADQGAGVWYSEGDGWADTAVGGPFRADCSGFVSMAWGMTYSQSTYSLPDYSHELTKGGSADYAQMRPGDVFMFVGDPNTGSGHVELFAGWVDSAHTVAGVYQEAHSGTRASYSTDSVSDFADNGFLPYRYNNVIDAPQPPPPAQTPPETAAGSSVVHDGYTSVYSVDAGTGDLQETYLPKVGQAWATQDLSVRYGTPAVLAGTEPVAIHHGSYTSVYTVDASSHHLQETYLSAIGSPWFTQDLSAKYGAPATQTTPTAVLHQGWLTIYTIDQGNGHLQETYLSAIGSPWFSKDLSAQYGTPAASLTLKPVAIMHSGFTSVYTIDAGTDHLQETYLSAIGAPWFTQDLSVGYGAPATSTSPTVAVHQGWTSVYTIDQNDGHLQETYLSAIGSPWFSKDLVPQSGTPVADAATAPVALFHDGYTSVYTVDAGSRHLQETYIDKIGDPWTSQDLSAKYGTPAVTGNIDALAHPDANQNMTYASVYSLSAGNNDLRETYLSAIGSAWFSQDLSARYGTPAASAI